MSLNKVRAFYLSGALFATGVMLLIWDRYSPAYCLLVGASVFAIATEVWVQKTHAGRAASSAQRRPVAETPPPARPAGESSEASLQREIEALTKLVAAKTREAENLANKLKDRRDIRILQRIAQLLAALDFNRSQIKAGRLTAEAALREIELELESTLSDLGLEVFEIKVGDRVRDLPADSFEGIRTHEPSVPEQSGTVKQVHQRAVVYKSPDGQTIFVMPAKIDTYKLTTHHA